MNRQYQSSLDESPIGIEDLEGVLPRFRDTPFILPKGTPIRLADEPSDASHLKLDEFPNLTEDLPMTGAVKVHSSGDSTHSADVSYRNIFYQIVPFLAEGTYRSPERALEPAKLQSESAWRSQLLSTSPLFGMGAFRSDDQVGSSHAEETAQRLADLVTAPSKRLNSIFDEIRASNDPEEVLAVALREYERTADWDYLEFAASFMKSFGARAWPALSTLSRSNRPECDWFVGAIARCRGISADERAQALLHLTLNPDQAVRSSILEALDALPSQYQRQILQVLASDRDGEISEEASERLTEDEMI